MLYEHRPSEGSFESFGRLVIQKMFNVTASSFHVGISRDKYLIRHFLLPRLTGVLYRYLQRKVLPELLLDVNLQTRLHLGPCRMTLHHVSFLQFGNSIPTFAQKKQLGGSTALPVRSPGLIPLDFISEDTWIRLFMLQESVRSRTSSNEYRMYLRWFLRLL